MAIRPLKGNKMGQGVGVTGMGIADLDKATRGSLSEGRVEQRPPQKVDA